MNNDLKNKVKYKISMFKFNEEIGMENSKIKYKKLAYGSLVILFVLTSVVSAKEIFKLFGLNAPGGVNVAVANGYLETVNADYQKLNDDISIKIDSFLIDNFNLAINFELSNLDYSRIHFNDLIIKNENDSIIFDSRINNLSNAINVDNNIIHLNIFAENIPVAKILKISLSNITVDNNTIKGNNISFSLDVPEKMQSRETIKYYAVSSNISNAFFEEANLSSTALKIRFRNGSSDYKLLDNSKDIWDISKNNNVFIELNDGRRIELASRSDMGGVSIKDNKIDFEYDFNLTKFEKCDNFKVHIVDVGEDMIINYQQEK